MAPKAARYAISGDTESGAGKAPTIGPVMRGSTVRPTTCDHQARAVAVEEQPDRDLHRRHSQEKRAVGVAEVFRGEAEVARQFGRDYAQAGAIEQAQPGDRDEYDGAPAHF